MRPRRRSRGGSHSSPRKASDCSGNQRAEFINKKQQSLEKEQKKKSTCGNFSAGAFWLFNR
ncbi:hypothetical protein ABE26_01845 [Cytobacillus firmus]|nr:hypothetical protein [Cytobacillus firmus]